MTQLLATPPAPQLRLFSKLAVYLYCKKNPKTMKIYLTIAETLGTDGVYFSEVYLDRSRQRAGELACSLIADFYENTGLTEPADFDPTATWELEGDGWFFRVRVEEQEV